MRKQKKSILVLAVITAFVATGFFLPKLTGAGGSEPPAPPVTIMETLGEIPPTIPPAWSQILPASERFVLVLNDEAVLDKETGLVWAKDAKLGDRQRIWELAVYYCGDLTIGNRKGWRLPTVEELASLIDPSQTDPALPSGHPFINVQPFYWSSTTCTGNIGRAWAGAIKDGYVYCLDKSHPRFVWPVRGGSGPILVPHTPTP